MWLYIARRDMRAADRAYEARCRLLADHPQLGPARPDIGDGVRILVIKRWLVLYRVTEDRAQIVRVMDGARDLALQDWPNEIDEARPSSSPSRPTAPRR